MKEKLKLNAVEETLLIPLYMRAKESKRKNAIIHDELACKIVGEIDYNFSKFENASMSALGCVIRGRHFDKKVQQFILREKNPIVVNIGCGLDTRYQRIQQKQDAIFYELDLPDVMELRKQLLPHPDTNDIPLTASLLETDWMDALKKKHPNSHFIFILEGVIMYFYEKQIKTTLTRLASRFPGGEIHFDVCGTMFLKRGVKNDSIKHTNAKFRSGINNGKIIEEWIPQFIMTDNISYMDIEKKRWGIKGFLIRLIPGLARKFSSILGYKIEKK
ncbi:MAG: class I SAM-dependent methyltransferase [Bacteroides sp.]|jgi:methyltransferase (TIGR00027 family)|nr:class I SAM-dependent methyltransferase [Bacteroides sp.]MCI1681473.1 class I SAM-dependent methyltransferase [Bacteroides sp.]